MELAPREERMAAPVWIQRARQAAWEAFQAAEVSPGHLLPGRHLDSHLLVEDEIHLEARPRPPVVQPAQRVPALVKRHPSGNFEQPREVGVV